MITLRSKRRMLCGAPAARTVLIGIVAALCVLVRAPSALAQSGSYYALVIGINQYQPPMPMLQTAAGDAEAVAKILSERYGFQVKLLLNGAATRAGILGAMDSYRASLHGSDSLLIYYAGHGYANHDEEKGYWLPVDAGRSTTAQWIIADELTSKMRAYPAKHVLVISDSCYSGELLRDAGISLRPDDMRRYLDKMEAGRSRTLMASGGDEPVSDGGGGGHSVFARAVLRALEDNDAKKFTAGDLFHDYVLRQVAGGADQTPLYSSIRNSGDDAGDFVFLRSAAKGRIERAEIPVAAQQPILSASSPAAPPSPSPEKPKSNPGGVLGEPIRSRPEETAKRGQALFYARQYAEALPLLQSAAQAGDANAEVELGLIYQKGLGVSEDYGEAIKWFRAAAEQGNARAENGLGVMFETGKGVPKDEGVGMTWIRKAAEQGLTQGQNNLGIAYEHGYGVTRDQTEAARWYRKAAEQGDPRAQCNLGYLYHSGAGVEQDDAESVKWYRMAAEGGDAEGQREFGLIYERGFGVSKDEIEAVKWYRKAAQQGDVRGQWDLGAMYEYGRGIAKDLGVALYWYEKAAAQEDAPLGVAMARDRLLGMKVVASGPRE